MPATFAQGSSGRSIRKIQELLSQLQVPVPGGGSEPALDPSKLDGVFGHTTRRAVQRAQIFFLLPATGEVNHQLWTKLTIDPWPDAYERSLGLIASFEGHNYTLAAGNYDGAGITWGVIGFTLLTNLRARGGPKYGSMVTLLNMIIEKHPDLFDKAFGTVPATLLQNMLKDTPAKLLNFAQSISTGRHNNRLIPSWQEGFRRLGEFPEIQVLQDKLAKELYYDKAINAASEFAQKYNMDSDQTNQLFFDIQVNNGGLSRNERNVVIAALNKLMQQHPNASLSKKLNEITEVLATSRPKFATDIRARKGTISNGFGTVHGKRYRLDGWGIEVRMPPTTPTPPSPPTPIPPPAPIGLRLGILSFDPIQQGEQLELASVATKLVLPEAAASIAAEGAWPKGNGTELLGTGTLRSLSFRGLLDPAVAPLIQPDGEDVLQAINLVFRDQIGILAVFGQATPMPLPLQQHAIIGRGTRGYAGMVLHKNRELRLVRQRTAGNAAEDITLDVSAVQRSLASCQLLILYTGFGIGKGSLPGQAIAWQQWMKAVGANPIVLGWYGNACVPRDAVRQFVAGEFFLRLCSIDEHADLSTLCTQPERVIQIWGQACYATFAKGSQKFLWYDDPIPGLTLMSSGAAALDPVGTSWYARADYNGTPTNTAMESA